MPPKDKSESKEFLKIGEAVARGFLDGVQYNSTYDTKAFTALYEACKQAAESLGKKVRAAAKVRAALNEAPPKVRHLALHGKKYRAKKKNINRALRDYQRRDKNDT